MSSAELLHDKTLIMMVGPSAIGKSTVMNEMARTHEDFAYVRAFTTRAAREGEQSHYHFIDRAEADDLLESGQAITHLEHPTTHDIYGTTAESYPGRYNLLDTLSGSVAQYRSLPFRKSITIAVTAPADQWKSWFVSRYPEPSPEAQKRLGEAVISINWALNDPETYWLVNREGTLGDVTRIAIKTVLNPPTERHVPEWPNAMLELIKKNIWNTP